MQSSPAWRRFTTYGFVATLLFDTVIGALAYQGTLWGYVPGIPHFDLAGHFVLIGSLAFFLDGALGYRPLTSRAPWLRLAPVAVLCVAGIEELAQTLTPRRTASVTDFIADLLGVFALSWLSRRAAERFASSKAR